MKRVLAPLLFGIALAAPAVAQKPGEAAQTRVELAIRNGTEINDHDQSAWLVTDALFEVAPDLRQNPLPISYITERMDADSVKTLFLLTEGDTSQVYFTGVVRNWKLYDVQDFTKSTARPLATPEQAERLKKTRQLRAAIGNQICGTSANVIAFASREVPGAVDYYLLPGEEDQYVIEFGGAMRVRINPDGSREDKAFSRSCISMDVSPSKEATDTMAMISLPPGVSDVPTEIHVFRSLSHHIPVYVAAETGLWEVRGSQIRLVSSKVELAKDKSPN